MSRVAVSDPDEILFWAERAPAYYWAPFGLATLLMAPAMPVDPVLVAGGLGLAAAICALNQHCFVFHLKASHIALRGAMLDRVHRVDWHAIREVNVDRVRHPLISGNGPRGRVSVVLHDGTRIGIAGISDPEDARAAINKLLASHRARHIAEQQSVPAFARGAFSASRHRLGFGETGYRSDGTPIEAIPRILDRSPGGCASIRAATLPSAGRPARQHHVNTFCADRQLRAIQAWNNQSDQAANPTGRLANESTVHAP